MTDRTAVIIAIVIAIVALAFVVMFPSKPAQGEPVPQPRPPCLDADMREKARALVLEGLDMALKHHTQTLFDVRQKDRERDPDRIVRGMRMGVFAYARSRAEVLKWSPPLCEEQPK